MQVLIASAWPAAALRTQCGSASSGRAIETMSASPAARMRSATSGMLMRLVAMSGRRSSVLSLPVIQAKAARGTLVTMVGTRASCQPMPVLMSEAPAASMARASCTTSSQREPSSTRSSMDRR